jgi:hypothetical protein
MAMACLRLFALPVFPLRCVPYFVFLTAFFTSRWAVELLRLRDEAAFFFAMCRLLKSWKDAGISATRVPSRPHTRLPLMAQVLP